MNCNDAADEVTKKHAPRLRRSCELCRSSKARCVPSPDGLDRCQRCVKDEKHCTFLEAKPRPKRAKNSRLRVAEMEQKLDGLYELLSSKQSAQSLPAASPQPQTITSPPRSGLSPGRNYDDPCRNPDHQLIPLLTPFPISFSPSFDRLQEVNFDDYHTLPSSTKAGLPRVSPQAQPIQSPPRNGSSLPFKSAHAPSFATSTPSSEIPRFQQQTQRETQPMKPFLIPHPTFDRVQDVISKGIVTLQQAEESVSLFRKKARGFPFVILPSYISLDCLRRERPFLLLAIITFAADYNVELQSRLELELRENLARKVIVNGEKTLELLQGVLVYLTWYHYYFSPEQQQVYQLCQMAAAMAVDLGINKKIGEPVEKHSGHLMHVPLIYFQKISEEELESRRTYVGCYYLTSTVCQHLRKSNNLKYHDWIDECAQSLSQAAHYEHDYLIPYFLRIQRFSEEVNHAFGYENEFQLLQSDGVRISILLRSFHHQYSQIEAEFPEEAWNRLPLKLAFLNLGIYIAEIGFHVLSPTESDPMSVQTWYYSSQRRECLLNCLSATKDYLDQVLGISNDDILSFTLTEFLHLIYAVLILCSFAIGCSGQTLDASQIRLEHYLNALSSKINLVVVTSKNEESNEYLSHIDALFQQSKVWYTQIILDPSFKGYSFSGLSFTEILPTIWARCMDFSAASEESCTSSKAMWDDMISTWSPPLDPGALQ